jgi:CDP-diacylglycerol--serine O-phosphatidyltransferase
MLKHFLNPPNWFTATSIFCSTYAITLVIGVHGDTAATLSRACVFVVFAGIFDLLDGRVARITNRETEFGVQLDSLADVISFGVAPAIITWVWKLQHLGIVGAFICFWWILAATFRLARFNVKATDEDSHWAHPGHSQGLTITMAGGMLVTLAWVSNGYLAHSLQSIPPWAVTIIAAALALLMVSSIPFRNFRDIRGNANARRILALAFAFYIGSGFFFHEASMMFGVGSLLYCTWGLSDGLLVAFVHRRKMRRAI